MNKLDKHYLGLRQMIHARNTIGAYAPGGGPVLVGEHLTKAIRREIHRSIEAKDPTRKSEKTYYPWNNLGVVIRGQRKTFRLPTILKDIAMEPRSNHQENARRLLRKHLPKAWNDLDVLGRLSGIEQSYTKLYLIRRKWVVKHELTYRSGIKISAGLPVFFNGRDFFVDGTDIQLTADQVKLSGRKKTS